MLYAPSRLLHTTDYETNVNGIKYAVIATSLSLS